MTKYKISTPHSDEDPELTPEDASGPMALASNEGSAVSELYDKDRIKKGWLGVREDENVLEYEDSEGNYWTKES